jgi:septal ring factor EnvC (AmiA/AmiB activator)
MQMLNKHIPWIQLILMIGALVLIYGQQVQSVKDIERRVAQCETDRKQSDMSYAGLLTAINDLKVDIRELKTELRYIRKGR